MEQGSRWTPLMGLRDLGRVVGRRMAWSALAWVVLYLSTQWMGEGVASLFALLVGSLAGVVIGWVMGEAAADTTLTGFLVWALVVLAAWVSIWVPEGLLRVMTGWPLTYGRWMMLTGATCFAVAAAVLRASVDA